MGKIKDLVGFKKEMLEVIRFSRILKRKAFWICKCQCGGEKEFSGQVLTRERVSNCGCDKKNSKRGKNNPHYKGYEDISGVYWHSLKYSAARRGLEFSISIQYAWDKFIEQKRACSLSGLPLNFSLFRGCDGNASLDRIDSSKGYIEGNVQWVDVKINYMKQNLMEEDFIYLCNKVSSYHLNNKSTSI